MPKLKKPFEIKPAAAWAVLNSVDPFTPIEEQTVLLAAVLAKGYLAAYPEDDDNENELMAMGMVVLAEAGFKHPKIMEVVARLVGPDADQEVAWMNKVKGRMLEAMRGGVEDALAEDPQKALLLAAFKQEVGHIAGVPGWELPVN